MLTPDRICDILRPMLSDARLEKIERVLARRTRRLTLVVDRLDKPHNYMAILRTAEAFGVQDIHIILDPAMPRQELSRKLTMGAHHWLTLHVYHDWRTAFVALRAAGYKLYASYLDETACGLEALDLSGKVALLFGNELEGFTAEQVAACDGRFFLPMEGFTQSFNVSVACALGLQRFLFACEAAGIAREPLGEDGRVALRAEWYRHSVQASDAILARAEREATQKA